MLGILIHGDGELCEPLRCSLDHVPVSIDPHHQVATPPIQAVHIAHTPANIPQEVQESGDLCVVFESKEANPNVVVCGGEYPEPSPSLISLITILATDAPTAVPYEKLHAVFDEVVSVGHHDFSEPARNIAFFADLLSKGGLAPERQADFLERTNIAATRLQALIRDLTRYARVWLRPIEEESLNEGLIGELAEAAYARSRIRVKGSGDPGISFEGRGSLKVPEKFLTRIFDELIANALEHHADDGAPLLVRLHPHDQAGLFCLEVIDNGAGIDVPSGVSLFRPFYRNERNDELRTGLGLALVKAMCERVGGEAELISTPDSKRARLRLLLPTTVN